MNNTNTKRIAPVRYISAFCNSCRKPYTIRIEKSDDGNWEMVFAYSDGIDQKKGTTGNTKEEVINGGLRLGEYYSCPHCGRTHIVRCGRCSTIVCHDGSDYFTCGKCGNSGKITGRISSFSAGRAVISSKKK